MVVWNPGELHLNGTAFCFCLDLSNKGSFLSWFFLKPDAYCNAINSENTLIKQCFSLQYISSQIRTNWHAWVSYFKYTFCEFSCWICKKIFNKKVSPPYSILLWPRSNHLTHVVIFFDTHSDKNVHNPEWCLLFLLESRQNPGIHRFSKCQFWRIQHSEYLGLGG